MGKNYHQFCGLAKAATVLGERWALLIVRDLSIGPRRFKDLHEGLTGIPTSLLTTRLRELENAGIVERRLVPAPGRGTIYALTVRGDELQPILDALGAWGARRMSEPEPEDRVTDASLAAALRTAHQGRGTEESFLYAVHVGPASAWAHVGPDSFEIGEGVPDATPHLTVKAGPELRMLLAGRISAADALASGAVAIDGPDVLFEAFTETFHVPLEDEKEAKI